ncbi:MAG: SGNH/GDSL hydrolase family protein [Clostridia bacterium]|nr:SGNH/GDSL hydrolase family protein [Clostridia bacterium]
MRNIYLIGDSIRFGSTSGNSLGYGVFVKEQLAGKANVYAPDENCRFVQYTQRYLHEWAENVDRESIDTVHWNNGLWDVLRIQGDEPFTDLDIYVRLLERVYRRIRQLFPNAKVIFALSTAVVEELAKPDFLRFNREIEAYNAAARELMERLHVQINDLYSVTKDWGEEMHSDFVHFNEAGCRILAERVIEKIMA